MITLLLIFTLCPSYSSVLFDLLASNMYYYYLHNYLIKKLISHQKKFMINSPGDVMYNMVTIVNNTVLYI